MVKTLPNAIDAEQSLLGTIMVYPNSAQIAIEAGMRAEYLFLENHKKIFYAINDLYNEQKPIDITTLGTRLNDLGILGSVGGVDYLMTLCDTSVSSFNTKAYVELIQNKAYMRNMIEACQKVVDEGFDGQANIDDYLDMAEKSVLNVTRSRRTTDFKSSATVVNNVLERIIKMSGNKSGITGLKTGFEHLDNYTHGFQRGDLIILAARPSMGKTAVALNFASKIAQYQSNEAVAIFSLEMAAEQLLERILSSKSSVPIEKIKTGKLSDNDWQKLNEAAATLRNTKMYIDDIPGIRVTEIFSKCRKLQSEQGLAAVFIDYIQLISGSGNNKENRQQEVSEISRNLKALARELNVPVIALSQLSRNVESRTDKRPMMSDLRESGAIEQDADIIMLLFRSQYYDRKDDPNEKHDPNEMQPLEIDIAKHRNGKTGVIRFAFQGSTNSIFTAEADDYMGGE